MNKNNVAQTHDFSFEELFESLPGRIQKVVRKSIIEINGWSRVTWYSRLRGDTGLLAIEAVKVQGAFEANGVVCEWINGVLSKKSESC